MNGNKIEALYVPKSYGTYSDTCLMLGLACLAEYALGTTGQKQGMQLIDEGTCYRIQFVKPMDLSKIEFVPYVDLFPPLIKDSTESRKLRNDVTPFNIKQEKDIRQAYIKSKSNVNRSDDVINFPDPRTLNSAAISELQYVANHNQLWKRGKELEDYFSIIVKAIFSIFSKKNVINTQDKIIENIRQGDIKLRTLSILVSNRILSSNRLEIRITLLTSQLLSPLLWGLSQDLGKKIAIAKIPCLLEPQIDLAKTTTYKDLFNQTPEKNISFRFYSPTSFKQDNLIQPFPLPELVFSVRANGRSPLH